MTGKYFLLVFCLFLAGLQIEAASFRSMRSRPDARDIIRDFKDNYADERNTVVDEGVRKADCVDGDCEYGLNYPRDVNDPGYGYSYGGWGYAAPGYNPTGIPRTHPYSSYPYGRYPNSVYPYARYPYNSYPYNGYPYNGYPYNSYPYNSYPYSRYPYSRYPYTRYPYNRYPYDYRNCIGGSCYYPYGDDYERYYDGYGDDFYPAGSKNTGKSNIQTLANFFNSRNYVPDYPYNNDDQSDDKPYRRHRRDRRRRPRNEDDDVNPENPEGPAVPYPRDNDGPDGPEGPVYYNNIRP